MDKLLEALSKNGIDGSSLDEEQVLRVARAVGLDPTDFLPREVKIGPYTNKRKETNQFVQSSPFVVGRKDDGTARTVKGHFLRVEALDQAIEDLLQARALRDAADSDKE